MVNYYVVLLVRVQKSSTRYKTVLKLGLGIQPISLAIKAIEQIDNAK